MQERSDSMTGNFILFLVLSFAILFGYQAFMARLKGPGEQAQKQQEPAKKDAQPDKPAGGAAGQPKPPDKRAADDQPKAQQDPKAAKPEPKKAAQRKYDQQWLTLGSADPDDPFRMLVTLTNKGAAVERIELSSPRYRDLEDRGGYLGHLVTDESVLEDYGDEDDGDASVRVRAVAETSLLAAAGLNSEDRIEAVGEEKVGGVDEFHVALKAIQPGEDATLTVLRNGKRLSVSMPVGAMVQVVGAGTPAAAASLKPDDLIVGLGDERIAGIEDLRSVLSKTKPGQETGLTVLRDGKQLELSVTLGRRPLEVVRPEKDDPASFLVTLQHAGGKDIGELTLQKPKKLVAAGKELDGVDLWTGNWEVVQGKCDRTHAEFRRELPELGLEVIKRYELAKVPEESQDDANYGAYHLLFDVEIGNLSGQPREVSYQLDGPTGLPAEGPWYAYKTGPDWGSAGLRDVVVSVEGRFPSWIYCSDVADAETEEPWQDESLTFIGVDAQYFSSMLLPQKDDPKVLLPPMAETSELWFDESHPLLVGEVDKSHKDVTNTSCRVISAAYVLAPQGQAHDRLLHRFEIFAGPKKPDVLTHYGLDELVYYGWFGGISKPLGAILHVFAKVGNYGVAILLLTALVRGCMFPLSKKQALGAQKMQELQPEMKRIQEKYKKDMEARTKAQQELFRKHNYNPLSGCLVLLVQLPIFIALYRLLSVDIELRQAPLLSDGIRWCSNLAAPDMLLDWSGFMPAFVVNWSPYFNVLPIFTIVLFIMQQKMFMPPPTDDQQALQQKIMKYMMIVFGFLFFRVASGLCIYFIASSLWGLAERKFLPKHTKPAAAGTAGAARSRADAKAQARAESKTTPKPVASGRDGAAVGKKKGKKSRGRR